jgi:hypothetical protein
MEYIRAEAARWKVAALTGVLLGSVGVSGCGRTAPLIAAEEPGIGPSDAGLTADSGLVTDATPASDSRPADAMPHTEGSSWSDGRAVADAQLWTDGSPRSDAGYLDEAGAATDGSVAPDLAPAADQGLAEDAARADGSPDAYPTQLPDLLPVDLRISREWWSVTYRVAICNAGERTSTYTTVELYLDQPSAPGRDRAPDRSSLVPPLQPRSCHLARYRVALLPGDYRSWVVVDRRDRIAESDESNNTAGPLRVRIEPTSRAPDLQLNRFTADLSDAGYVTYQMGVCNRGNLPSGPTTIGLFYDQEAPPGRGSMPDVTIDLPVLQRGRCITRVVSTRLAAGTYESWAVVDPDDRIRETNETNNSAGPREVAVSTDDGCATICTRFHSPCGLIRPDEQPVCQLLCAQESELAIDCALRAAEGQRCIGIIGCFLRF